MKLVFLSNLYPPYIVGGNEMLCHDVVTALRERGHVVTVLTGHGRELPTDGVEGCFDLDLDRKHETFLGGREPGSWEAFRRHIWNRASGAATRDALARLQPDLVVVWNLYMASLAPLAAALGSRRPVVVHVADKWLHYGLDDVSPLLDMRLPRQRLVRTAQTWLHRLLRSRARPSRVVAISDFMRRFYIGAGWGEGEVETIHLGVPTRRFSVRDPPLPPAAGLRLLYVGSLWEGKGPQTAIRALGHLARAGDQATRLDICGAGTPGFQDWLQGVIAEEGLAERVVFHGFQDREQVRAAYHDHDVLVFPSQWDEPFAAVPVEAMSCGLAIVATTAGGTPEAISDGETGLLVPPADPRAMAEALRRLAEDAGLRRRLGAAAARTARERFDFDHYVGRLDARYAELSGCGP